jgi:hypothetical protein
MILSSGQSRHHKTLNANLAMHLSFLLLLAGELLRKRSPGFRSLLHIEPVNLRLDTLDVTSDFSDLNISLEIGHKSATFVDLLVNLGDDNYNVLDGGFQISNVSLRLLNPFCALLDSTSALLLDISGGKESITSWNTMYGPIGLYRSIALLKASSLSTLMFKS